MQTGQRREYFLIMISASIMNRITTISSIAMFAIVLGLGIISPAMAASTIVPTSVTGVVEPGAEIEKTMTVSPEAPLVAPYTVTPTNDCGVDAIGNPIVTITPSEFTGVVQDAVIVFTEEISAMPGAYSCTVSFTVEDASGAQETIDQTIDVDVVGSKGYWTHHEDAVISALGGGKDLGTHTVSDSAEAIDILSQKGKNTVDKVARQLLAAKLNEMAGVDSACITATITATDALLSGFPYTGVESVPNSTTKPIKSTLTGLNELLDDFNNQGCP